MVQGLILKTLARWMMDFCMFHYFSSCNSVNDLIIMALHVLLTECLEEAIHV